MGDLYAGSSLKLTVERCVDKDLIRDIISHEEIANGFCEPDEIDDYVNGLHEIHTCYLMMCQGEIAGISVILHASGDTMYAEIAVVDIGFYKRFRGSVAAAVSRLALNKFFNENRCDQLVAVINKDNKAAMLNAKWLGFAVFSENKSDYYLRYKKNGQKHGRIRQS